MFQYKLHFYPNLRYIMLILCTFLFFVITNSTIWAATKFGWSSFHSTPTKEIDKGTRAIIHEVNRTIIKSIQSNDSTVMYELSSDETKKAGKDSFIKLYKELNQLIGSSKLFTFYDNLVKVSARGQNTIDVPSETKEEFYIRLTAKSPSIIKEEKQTFYISQLNTEGEYIDRILTFVYRRYDNEWKLYSFNLGDLRIAGKSAIEWYQEARSVGKKGQLVPALLRLKYIKKVLNPAPYMRYKKEREILSFNDDLVNSVNKLYSMPISMPGDSEIAVYSIDSLVVDRKVLPLLNFFTNTPLTENQAIRKEALMTANYIAKIMPGIFDYNEKLLLRAYNEPPIELNKYYKYFAFMFNANNLE